MNDQELTAALRAFHIERTRIPDQPALHERVQALPLDDMPQQRPWLPLSPKWRLGSMFSATKFVVAGAIVALFGAFLLAGVVTQPSEEVAPAATSAGPGTFSPTGSLAQPRAEHTATLLPDGRVLVVGGFDVRQQDSSTSTAEIWDPDTETFGPTGSLAEPRISHTATLLPDGRVLVVGGWGDDDTEGRGPRIASAEVWDPSSGAFSPAGSTSMGGSAFVTLLPDGRVLVMISDDVLASADVWEEVASAEVWDPATSTFSPADSLLLAMSMDSAPDDLAGGQRATTLADGRVLIISDEDPYGYAYPASAEVWDPVTDTFSPAGSSALGRIRSSTLLADGRVLFLGEYSTSDEDMTSAEVWDPATSTFSPAGSFPGAYRGMNTVTALADGRALIAGGCTYREICYEHFDSAEVWDPATETFGPTGSPAVTRMRHTATALPDGRVLVVGGWEYLTKGTVRASAEVWEPGPSSEPPWVDETTEADDTTTPDLLSGVDLVTEEVEPGVYRVLGDAAGHDLVAEPPASVTVAPDGSVWLLRSSRDPESEPDVRWQVDALLHLGHNGTHRFESSPGYGVDLAVDVDGVAWLGIEPLVGEPGSVPYGTLASFDGTTWAAPTWPDGSGDIGAIEATSDGTVWVAQGVELGAGPSVARIEDGTWTVLPSLDDPALEGRFRGRHEHFVAATDGTAWLTNGGGGSGTRHPGPLGLLHFDGERWNVVDLPIEGRNVQAGPLALGPNGTLWVYVRDGEAAKHLVRLDADGWTTFSEADAVPELVSHYQEARMAVDADDRLWIALGDEWGSEGLPPSLGPFTGPVGVLMFDGTTWHQYLEGFQVNRVDVADDGTVFATALYGRCPTDDCGEGDRSGEDWSMGGLYVITPEAVAAAE